MSEEYYRDIKDLISRTQANAKVITALGKSGALSDICDLNELESAEYGKSIIGYLKEVQKKEDRDAVNIIRNKESKEKYQQRLKDLAQKESSRRKKYQDKLREFNENLLRIREINRIRIADGKKLLKDPVSPKPFKPLSIPSEPVMKPLLPIPEEPETPKIALSGRDRIRLQREYLNMYLSGHPLDELKKDPSVVATDYLHMCAHRDVYSIRGVLLSLKEINTKKKKLMALMRLEDRSGSIEIVIFPRLYTEWRGSLVEGDVYKVTGNVEITSSQEDDETISSRNHSRIIAQKIEPVFLPAEKRDWEILYPLLKGSMRILPPKNGLPKPRITTILKRRARGDLNE